MLLKKTKIAIAGIGTVGSGVIELFKKNSILKNFGIEITAIASRRIIKNILLTKAFNLLSMKKFFQYSEKMEFFKEKKLITLNTNKEAKVKGTLIKIINIIPSSGLLLKRDPGVPLVYTSFAIILIGGSLSLISTKKLWVLYEKEKSLIYIGGLSNRNLSGLSKELPKFIGLLNN